MGSGKSCEYLWKPEPCRESSICKGTEAGTNGTYLKKSKEAQWLDQRSNRILLTTCEAVLRAFKILTSFVLRRIE